MSRDANLLSAVRVIVERVASTSRTPADIGPDTPLADGLWLDSIELLEVVVACETEFGIVFDETTDLRSGAFDTLGTLTDLVQSKRASGRMPS